MELYLFLTDQCNFNCAHCITSSTPSSSKVKLSENEIIIITSLINSDSNIDTVHFSGGEPTLELEKILTIQALIKRKIRYSITTNGSFILQRTSSDFFDKILIHEIFLSFDKYHAKYISTNSLIPFIKEATKRDIPVQIRFTYEDLKEIAIAQPLLISPLVKLLPGTVMQGGRFTKSSRPSIANDPMNNTCPSMNFGISGRKRWIFYPNKGFSICCGPLTFDHSSNTFSDSPHENDFSRLFENTNFAKIFKSYNLQIPEQSTYPTTCDACVSLFGSIDHTKAPPMVKIISQNKRQIIQINRKPDLASLFALEKHFESKVIYFNPQTLPTHNSGATSTPKEISKIENSSKITDTQLLDFYNKIFFSVYDSFTNNSRLNNIQNIIENTRKAQFTGYFKNNKLAGIIVTEHREKYPYADHPGLHVGFIGYDKSIVSKNEAAWLKNDFINTINNQNLNKLQISTAIDYFNIKSHNFFQKLNFKPTHIWLEPRNNNE